MELLIEKKLEKEDTCFVNKVERYFAIELNFSPKL